MTLTCW